jgi:small subunit ribosomal protein S2
MPRKKKSDTKTEKPAEVEEAKFEKAEEKAEKTELTEKAKEELKEKLMARAKELAGGMKEEKIEKKKKSENLLVPVDDYIQYGCYLGTKVITAQMQKYVYKRRADGLAIFNTDFTDNKLRAVIKLLSEYAPKDIVVCCKRKAGWNALEVLSKVTGIRVFSKKYPAGIMTNTRLGEFFEPKIMFIIDPWLDKNPMMDAVHVNIPIVSICDTNNITQHVDAVIPCNNKSNKSIGLVFWIIAREYCKARGIEAQLPPIDEFVGPDVI